MSENQTDRQRERETERKSKHIHLPVHINNRNIMRNFRKNVLRTNHMREQKKCRFQFFLRQTTSNNQNIYIKHNYRYFVNFDDDLIRID